MPEQAVTPRHNVALAFVDGAASKERNVRIEGGILWQHHNAAMIAKDTTTPPLTSRLPVWSGREKCERGTADNKIRRKRSPSRVRFGEVEIMTFRKPPVVALPAPRWPTPAEAMLSSPVVQRRGLRPLFDRRSRVRIYQDSIKHVIQEGFVFRKGAHVTYSCVYSFVLDYADGDAKRSISPKDVVGAVAHAYPKVIPKPTERHFCLFMNMAKIDRSILQGDVLKVTKKELPPMLDHSAAIGMKLAGQRSPRKNDDNHVTKSCVTSPPVEVKHDATSSLESLEEDPDGRKKTKMWRWRELKVHLGHKLHASGTGRSMRGDSGPSSPEEDSLSGSDASAKRAEFRLMGLFRSTVNDDDTTYRRKRAMRKSGTALPLSDAECMPYGSHEPCWVISQSDDSLKSSTTTGTLSTLTSNEEVDLEHGVVNWGECPDSGSSVGGGGLETVHEGHDSVLHQQIRFPTDAIRHSNDIRCHGWNTAAHRVDNTGSHEDKTLCCVPADCLSSEGVDAGSCVDAPNRYYFSAFLLQTDNGVGHSGPRLMLPKAYLTVPLRHYGEATRRRNSLENTPFHRRQRLSSYRRHSSESNHGEVEARLYCSQPGDDLPSRCSSESMLVRGEERLSFKSNNIPSRDEFGVLTNQAVSVLCRPRARLRTFSGSGIPVLQRSTLHRRDSVIADLQQQQLQDTRQWEQHDCTAESVQKGVVSSHVRMAVVETFTPQVGNKITLTEVRYHLAKAVGCSVTQLPDDDVLLKCFFEVFESFGFEMLTDKLTCEKTVSMLHIKHRRQLLVGQGKQRSLPETETQLIREQKCRPTGLFNPIIYDIHRSECELRRRNKTTSAESLLIAT